MASRPAAEAECIETSLGSRIARTAVINGANRISISDNCTIGDHCVLEGSAKTASNLAISLGKYVFIEANCTLDPLKENRPELAVGNYAVVGSDTVVHASQIGNRVLIGRRCTIGYMSVINDCCVVEPDTVVPPLAVVPPYSRVSGKPGRDYCVQQLSPAYRKTLETEARLRHAMG